MVVARWLRPRMGPGDPAALSLYGMLYLRTAVAVARHQDRSTAHGLLRKLDGRLINWEWVRTTGRRVSARPIWNWTASLLRATG
jgi:hypothetical protein